MHRNSILTRIYAMITVFAFGVNMIGPLYAQSGPSFLPDPGHMIALSRPFNPLLLKGLKVYPDNPFRFEFILNPGDASLAGQPLKEASARLIKYFLASLTIPEKDLWVNLSPYEKNRIVPETFGQTEMGRDLLAQDYLLKQITASAIYPESDLGQQFWHKVYAQAQQKYGTTDIPIDTFNKVWIVPAKAALYENAAAGTAYITGSSLKVMLESDYKAITENESFARRGGSVTRPLLSDTPTPQGVDRMSSDIAKNVLREFIIPALEKEVNTGENFAQLRQIYQALILATWYKQKVKNSLLSRVYVDRHKITGVRIPDPRESEKIWSRYVEAFQQGVFNYIQETRDPATMETIPRKFFAGGVDASAISTIIDASGSIAPSDAAGNNTTLSILLVKTKDNASHEQQAQSLYESIWPSLVPWEKLPAISQKVFEWSRGKNDWEQLLKLRYFHPRSFLLSHLPALASFLGSQQDWINLYPFIKHIASFDEHNQDVLYNKTLPALYACFKDRLPIEQILVIAGLLKNEIPSQEIEVFINTFMKPHLETTPLSVEDFIAESNRLLEWNQYRSINNFYPFIGSALSKDDITPLLASSQISEPDKFKLLTGFCVTHPEAAAQDMLTYFNQFKSGITLSQASWLILAFGKIKTPVILPYMINLWNKSDDDNDYENGKIIFLSTIKYWPRNLITALLKSDDIPPSFALEMMATEADKQSLQDAPNDLCRTLFKISSYQEIIKSLRILNRIPDALILTPLIDRLFQSMTTSIQLSLDHGIGAEGSTINIANLKSIGTFLHFFITNAPNLAYNCKSSLTRLIRRLPIGNRQIKRVKDIADQLVDAVGGRRLILEGGAHFIVDLRDEIHKHINFLTVFKVKAYAHYLSTGDQTMLRAMEVTIDDEAPFSKLSLMQTNRITNVETILNELIEKMNIIFNGGGTNSKEVIVNYNLSIHPLNIALRNSFDAVLTTSETLDTLLSQPLNNDSLVEGLRLMTQLKESLATLRADERYRDEQLLFLLLDVELETYLYRLLAKIPPEQEMTIPTLLAILHPVIGLARESFNIQAQEELGVISDELRQIIDAEKTPGSTVNGSPLRVFAIVERLLRRIRQFSQETSAVYQPIVNDQTRGQNIFEKEKIDDVTADLIRVENPYQLSLVAQQLEAVLARELHLSWLVARPGTGQGQLIHVKESDNLQQVIDQLTQPAILIAERIPNNILLNPYVRGYVTREEQGVLSHPAIRSDNNAPVVLVQAIGSKYTELIATAEASPDAFFQITAADNEVAINKIDTLDPMTTTAPQAAIPVEADLSIRGLITDINAYTPETVGNKGYSLKRLHDAIERLKAAGLIPQNFILSVPQSIALPFGYFEAILDANGAMGQQIRTLREQLKAPPDENDTKGILIQLEQLILQLDIDPEMIDTIAHIIGASMVRLCPTVDDLSRNAAAGVYGSFEHVARAQLGDHIRRGYASLYTLTAFMDRRQHQIEEDNVHAAMIFQIMATGNAFVAFSQDPTLQNETDRRNAMLLEMIPGLGKTLMSGEPEFQGSPHRFRYSVSAGNAQRLAYANKSYRLVVDAGVLQVRLNDYRQDPLSQEENPSWIKDLFALLRDITGDATIGRDMEGSVEFKDGIYYVFLLQDRDNIKFNTTNTAGQTGKDAKRSTANPEYTGGIDLRAPALTLNKSTVHFQFSPDQLAAFESAPGLRPVILKASPIKDLKLFLSTPAVSR